MGGAGPPKPRAVAGAGPDVRELTASRLALGRHRGDRLLAGRSRHAPGRKRRPLAFPPPTVADLFERDHCASGPEASARVTHFLAGAGPARAFPDPVDGWRPPRLDPLRSVARRDGLRAPGGNLEARLVGRVDRRCGGGAGPRGGAAWWDLQVIGAVLGRTREREQHHSRRIPFGQTAERRRTPSRSPRPFRTRPHPNRHAANFPPRIQNPPIQASFSVVPGKGLEPLQPCGHRLLRPACLPIPPTRHEDHVVVNFTPVQVWVTTIQSH